MRPGASVLIVDDEAAILTLLRYNLEKLGLRVFSATNGEDALTLARHFSPDMVVLDWMLPSVSGVEVCRRLRNDRELANVPIVMLTARSDERDRVHGLGIGADDYITKPFSTAELVARMTAVLRRIRPALTEEVITVNKLNINLTTRKVFCNGSPVRLGPREFSILRLLMENPGRVLSRGQILDRAWEHSESVELRTVDVHIGRLRKVLAQSGGRDCIRTVRSAGYVLDTDAR